MVVLRSVVRPGALKTVRMTRTPREGFGRFGLDHDVRHVPWYTNILARYHSTEVRPALAHRWQLLRQKSRTARPTC